MRYINSCGYDHDCQGLTLVELLVVLLVLGIVIGLAAPSLSAAVRSTRLSTLTNHMLADLAMTRSESVRHGGRASMCATADGLQCNSPSWQYGRLIFVDENHNGLVDTGERVLRYTLSAPAGWAIRGNVPVARYVSYNAMGQTRLITGAFQAGTITICPVSNASVPATQIVINSVGRARSQRVVLPDCMM